MRKLTFLLFLIVASLAHAGSRWQRIGPNAGTVTQLLSYPANPDIVFAINDGTLFRSTDRGLHWTSNPIPNAQFVQVAPSTGQVFLLSYPMFDQMPTAKTTLWVSSDEGKSFTVRTVLKGFTKIFIHPEDVKVMIGIDQWNLALSSDGGFSWKDQFDVETGDEAYYFNGVFFSPFDSKTIYISGSHSLEFGANDVTFVSTNLGRSWRGLPIGNSSFTVVGKRVFAASCHGVQMLTESGWTRLSKQPLTEIEQVPGEPQVLYGVQACSEWRQIDNDNESLWRSSDGGKTWNPYAFPYPNALTTVLAISTDGLLAGTAGAGLYLKTPQSDWKQVRAGLNASAMVQTAAGGPYLYATSLDSRQLPNREFLQQFLFRRNVQAGTWAKVPLGIDSTSGALTISVLAANPADSRQVFAGYARYGDVIPINVLYSSNGGQSWLQSLFDTPPSTGKITFDSGHPGIVYYGANCKSTDGGRSFKLIEALGGSSCYGEVTVDPRHPSTIYFVYQHGFYQSTDGGISIQLLGKAPVSYAQVIPLSPRGTFLLMAARIFKTTDTGKTWKQISYFRFFDFFRFSRLYAAGPAGQHLFAVIGSFYAPRGRLYESRDGGETWRNINAEFGGPSTEIYSMTDPSIQPFFVATSNGVFASAVSTAVR